MAVDYDVITGAELAAFQADYPILCGQSKTMLAAEGGSMVASWGTVAGGNTLDLSTHPAARVADGFHHLPSKTDAAIVSAFLSIDFGAAYEFDVCALLGHNAGDGGWTSVALRCYDGGWAGAATQVHIWTGLAAVGDKRLSVTMMRHAAGYAYRYRMRYWAFEFTFSAGTVPQVSEVFFGRRRQMAHHPDNPHDPGASVTSRTLGQTQSGVMAPWTNFRGRHVADLKWAISDAASISALQSWWSDSQHGTKPSLWIPRPYTAPQDAYAMFPEPAEFRFPYVGYEERRAAISLLEQGDSFVQRETA